MRLLIERGDVDTNTRDKDGWTPLLWAVLRLGAAINAEEKNGQSRSLVDSLVDIRKHEAVVRLLLESCGVVINTRDKEGHGAGVRLLKDHPALWAENVNSVPTGSFTRPSQRARRAGAEHSRRRPRIGPRARR